MPHNKNILVNKNKLGDVKHEDCNQRKLTFLDEFLWFVDVTSDPDYVTSL